MPLNDFDGAFLDTAHLRFDGMTPPDWFVSFCDPVVQKLDECWKGPAQSYFERLVADFKAGPHPYLAIGNFGALITGWDDNEYLSPLDGGMIEHFMFVDGRLGENDWHIAAERITRLIGNDRVFIAEPFGYDLEDPAERTWILANFLLFKGKASFAAFYPGHLDAVGPLVWLPEYELDVGRAAAAASSLTALCTEGSGTKTCAGVYQRRYANALVVVNPAQDPRRFTLPMPSVGTTWAEVTFHGVGYVEPSGEKSSQRTVVTAVVGPTVELLPSSALVIVPFNERARHTRQGRFSFDDSRLASLSVLHPKRSGELID